MMFGRTRELEDALQTMTTNLAEECSAHRTTKSQYDVLIENYNANKKFSDDLNEKLAKTRRDLHQSQLDLSNAIKEQERAESTAGELILDHELLQAKYEALVEFLACVNVNVEVKRGQKQSSGSRS